MQYWIILGVLIAVALILAAVIITVFIKSRQSREDGEYDEDYDEDVEDEEPEERVSPRRRRSAAREDESEDSADARRVNRRPKSSEAEEADGAQGGIPEKRPVRSQKPEKQQWKVILENLESWKKITFTFYDNIGMGRSRNNPQFEKYLSLTDDPRVSKIHCAIIRNGDKLYVKDLGSRNGTYLNEVRITQPVLIQKDDIIRMGETRIEIKSVLREKAKEAKEEEEME